jgi:hypothetical protein
MLPNNVIFVVSALLAASCFIVPLIYRHSNRLVRAILVLTLFLVVFALIQLLCNTNTAIAIVVLGIVLAVVSEVLAIDFRFLSSAHHPKDRRCY